MVQFVNHKLLLPSVAVSYQPLNFFCGLMLIVNSDSHISLLKKIIMIISIIIEKLQCLAKNEKRGKHPLKGTSFLTEESSSETLAKKGPICQKLR